MNRGGSGFGNPIMSGAYQQQMIAGAVARANAQNRAAALRAHQRTLRARQIQAAKAKQKQLDADSKNRDVAGTTKPVE